MIGIYLKRAKWLLLAGWVAFIYISYLRFWRDNVFWGETILWKSLGEVFFRIFLLVLFLLISAALGKRIFRWVRFETGSFLESLLFGLVIGLAVFTYLFIGLGLIGLFNRWAVNLSLLGMYLVSYPEIKDIIHQIKARLKNLLSSGIPSVEILLVLVILIQVVFNLAGASVLPSGWDALATHLATAKEWTYLHRLTYINYLGFHHCDTPFNVVVLYAMALLVKDAILAKLIHFAFGLLTAVGIYALGKRYFSSPIGLFSAAIFYLVPAVSHISTTAYVDLGFTFYAFLAIYALVNWITSPKKSWLIISAIVSGLCLGSKYTSFLWVALLLLAILINNLLLDRKKLSLMVKNLLLFTVLTGLVGCFWYLRGFLISGVSVFSYLYYLLRGEIGRSAFAASGIREAFEPAFSSLAPYLSLPWEITMHGSEFGRGAVGLLFLSFLPFLLFRRFRKSSLIKFFLYYSGAYLFFWAWSFPYKRGLLPIFPLLSIMVAYVVNEIFNFHRLLRGGLFALLFCTFIFQIFYLAPEGLNKVFQRLSVFVGLKSQREYILSNEETYRAFEYINGCLPVDSKLFIINEPRTFYCERRYATAIVIKGSLFDASSLGRGKYLLTQFRKAGFTHLVINQRRWDLGYGRNRYGKLLQDLRERHLQLLYDEHHFRIFKIHYG
jgi:4-amino-4-deoxy-L-arabinose transferase-like glycosyltransferase